MGLLIIRLKKQTIDKLFLEHWSINIVNNVFFIFKLTCSILSLAWIPEIHVEEVSKFILQPGLLVDAQIDISMHLHIGQGFICLFNVDHVPKEKSLENINEWISLSNNQ